MVTSGPIDKKEGKRVSVDVKGAIRSNAQNSYYFGVVVNILADYTGYTQEEMHSYLKRRFLAPHEVIIGDDSQTISPSTTKLSTEEFTAYIEAIRRWAAMDLGLSIPDPRSV